MKRFLLGLFVSALVCSAASAEIMTTACPLGQGKWGAMSGAMVDYNYSAMGGKDVMLMDAVGYGISDNLDVYLSGGIGYSEKTAAMSIMSMTAQALNLKYTLIGESLTAPVSLAVTAGIKSMPSSMAAMDQTQLGLGLVVSKMVNAFTPYAGVAYRTANQNFGNYSQIDLTVGTAFGPMERMLMVEYTVQMMTLTDNTSLSMMNGGTSFTSDQITVGGCVALN